MKNIIEIFHCTPFIEVGNTREYIDRIIDDVPTAFDTNKVIEKFENSKETHEDECGFDDFDYIEYEDAISIIKSSIGGGLSYVTENNNNEVGRSCSTCKNNVLYPPPHTCDICTSLDQEEEYEMWKEK